MVFKSRSENIYLYDNNSGQIFLCGKKDKEIKEEYLQKLGKYQNKPIRTITPNEIKNFLIEQGNGFKQLIFEMTSQCNFRCKYCCYSECYELTHGYTNDYLNFDIAKKAIDYYVCNFSQVVKRNPLAEMFISFYGGEPLLNFKLVKKIIEYTETEYSQYKFAYNMTTNGLLLDEETADYLVEKDVAILVSLDGPEEEQDRNRVDCAGNGTFARVIKNIRGFKEKYPKYVKFSISACYDWKTNFKAVENFFEEEGLIVSKFSPIDFCNTSYYEQFTQDDLCHYNDEITYLKEKMCELSLKGELNNDRFVYQALGVGYLEFAYHTMIGDSKNDIIPYTGTCIPGEKLYVMPDGSFHVCEKINPNYSIGNVKNGLDFKKIADMINCYNHNISEHCTKCDISKLCSNCFVKFASTKNFQYRPELCKRFRETVRQNLINLVDLLERDPRVTEKLTVGYYEHLMKHLKSCV